MSRFKSDDPDRFVVCRVTMQLAATTEPPRYPDLIAELGRRGVTSPEPAAIRDAVLAIRRRKGMVLDAADPDTRSVGSFFMNPVVAPEDQERIATLAGASVPGFATADGRVKIPAAWLIEHAGLGKGAGGGPVGLSTKHPLAIVNRGRANARDVIRFAGQVKRAVIDWCGVWLRPEPVFVGLDGDEDAEFLRKARG
jgi:UDP-N-acetylmuramate dehydrogenase